MAGHSHNKGLAQGAPLSPLLANLYLDAFDEKIHGRGIRLVRFADDFVVLCKKRKTAEKALQDVSETLGAHGLELHAGGTRILDFNRGFEFLGHLFVRSMIIQKISDPEDDVVGFIRGLADEDLSMAKKIKQETQAGYDRGARVLYLADKNRRLTLRNLSFSVRTRSDEEIANIAHSRVDRIEVGPGASLDWRALEHALASSTDLVLVDRKGGTRGRVIRPETGSAELQHAQALCGADQTTRTHLARCFVTARIRNQRTQLFRLNRRPQLSQVVVAVSEMGRTLRKLEDAKDVPSLLGLEGAAAASYWPALGLLCKGATKPFRRQRPAQEPLNAVVNYLSAILARDILGATISVGLHPGFGILHTPRDRADAAVYDLMEPFRAPLSEGLAVYLFNANRLRPDMFTCVENGTTQISTDGRRAIITGYEQALAKRIKYPGKKSRLAWRPTMRRQSQQLAKAYRALDPRLFTPYVMDA